VTVRRGFLFFVEFIRWSGSAAADEPE